MRREIKFRAWDETSQTLADVLFLSFDNKKAKIRHWEYGESIWLDFKEMEFLQYTGLEDKNGKEIYEGDVVHFKTDGLSGKGFVYLDEEVAQFWIEDIREQTKKRGKRYYPFYKDGTYRIVGNIYENPELLEESK